MKKTFRDISVKLKKIENNTIKNTANNMNSKNKFIEEVFEEYKDYFTKVLPEAMGGIIANLIAIFAPLMPVVGVVGAIYFILWLIISIFS